MIQPPLKHRASSATLSSFNRLEDCIRRVRRMLMFMLCLIAILPTTAFFCLGILESQEQTQVDARQMAFVVSTHLEKQGASLTTLSPRLLAMMKNANITFLQLLAANASEILRLGEPQRQFLTFTAEAHVFPPIHSIQSVVIQHNMGFLYLKAARVFGIHLLVASILTVIVYAIPMRALRQAVTDVKAAHMQILHSDKLSAIGGVYASLTHEINNPLSILLSRVKLLIGSAHEQHFPTELLRDLEVIEHHGNRIADIIRGLLTFSRKTPFEFAKTDLNRVIDECMSLVEKPFAKQGITIKTDLTAAPLVFSGSYNHLQQVFLNLLNNSRDAMPNGGEIAIRTLTTKTRVIAEIQDSGSGIPVDVQEKIFEPFFTTKDVGKGTGLGLPISYGIIRDHNGEIEVESTPGKGTMFRVTLPQQ